MFGSSPISRSGQHSLDSPDLLARHEFHRAVRPDVDNRVRFENFFEISVESRKAMMRRSAIGHQQAHRIVFKAKCRLHADKNVPERDSLNQQLIVA